MNEESVLALGTFIILAAIIKVSGQALPKRWLARTVIDDIINCV